MKFFVPFMCFIFLLGGCVGSVSNLNPLAPDSTKKNKSIARPVVTNVNASFDRVTITGTSLDKVTGMAVTGWGNNHALSISAQTENSVEAVVTSANLIFYAQRTYDLIISSASAETIYPITFSLLDNTVSTSKLQSYSVTSSKIANQGVTYGKIATTDAEDGDVLTYSSDTDTWAPMAPSNSVGDSGGGISILYKGAGLVGSGGSLSNSSFINVNIGSGSGQIPTLDGDGNFVTSNVIVLDAAADDEGILSLLDSTGGSDFRISNVSGVFSLQFDDDISSGASYANALTISNTGNTTFALDVTMEGGLTINASDADNIITFPASHGTAGQTLVDDGNGGLSWTSPAGGGTVTSITAGEGLVAGTIVGVGTIDVDVGIAAGQIPQLDGGGKILVGLIPALIPATKIGAGNVSDTEYNYLNGVTSLIQDQLDGKESVIAPATIVTGTYFYYSDGIVNSWRSLSADDVTETGAKKFMDILTYDDIADLPASGVASTTQPVSEKTVALLKASVASLNTPLSNLNALNDAPDTGSFVTGDGTDFSFTNFIVYLNSQLHPSGNTTSLLIGSGVGSGTLTGANNVGVGRSAMAAITSGTSNTALGHEAHKALTTGVGNTAIGKSAQDDLTTGNYNTTVGSLIMDTTAAVAATGNTAVGYQNLRVVTSNYNSAFGYDALKALTSGASNVAVGAYSGDSLTTGGTNALLGYNAGTALTTGAGNTLLGYGAGVKLVTASSNVIIGSNAGPTAAPTNSNLLYIDNSEVNTPLIGGNFATSVVYINHTPDQLVDLPGGAGSGLWVDGSAYKSDGDTAWAIPSDRRLKDRIVPYDRGLEEILAIRPVRFYYKDNPIFGTNSNDEHIGVIAQEVREEIPEAVVEGRNGYLNFKLDPVVWAGINAIQELNEKVETLEQENKMLKTYLCAKDPKAPFCQ